MESESHITYAPPGADILESQCRWIVIPVNCRGTMGAGLARQTAERWPAAAEVYRRFCRRGDLAPGRCATVPTGDGRALLLFPSKDDWRRPSTTALVEAGLRSLEQLAEAQRPELIAMPPVGCGLGGLSFADVEPLVCGTALPPGTGLVIYAPTPPPGGHRAGAR